jgi:CRISPR-associated protein Csd1
MITGLANVGGGKGGDALASFKQESFCSYGLVQARNAAMSEAMAAVYRTALNDLLRHRSVRLTGAKVVYWYAGKDEVPKNMDPLAKALGPIDFGDESVDADENNETDDNSEPNDDVRTVAQAEYRGRSILEAIKTGKREDLLDYRFYALTLSGNSGRVVIRNWMEGRFQDLAHHVDAWFEDLSIQNISGRRLAAAPKFERVVTCLLQERPLSQKYDDWIKPISWGREALWTCAIQGRSVPIPEAVVRRVLLRERQAMLNGETAAALDSSGDKHALRLANCYVRCGLLKAYILRKGNTSVESYLNEDHPQPAYHAGRLLAVFQYIQAKALGDPNASFVDRYYASASLTPAQTMPRIWNLARHHLRGIRDDDLRKTVLDLLTEIHGKLRDSMPPMLGLEQQSLFQLGFFQQQPALSRLQGEDAEDEPASDNLDL